jgi:hypothetical protein
MMERPSDGFLRAYARLIALRKNASEERVSEEFGNELNAIVDQVSQEAGVDLSDFRIPEGYYYHPRAGWNNVTGVVNYHPHRVLKGQLFLAKLDGAIIYIDQLLQEEPVRRMGF